MTHPLIHRILAEALHQFDRHWPDATGEPRIWELEAILLAIHEACAPYGGLTEAQEVVVSPWRSAVRVLSPARMPAPGLSVVLRRSGQMFITRYDSRLAHERNWRRCIYRPEYAGGHGLAEYLAWRGLTASPRVLCREG